MRHFYRGEDDCLDLSDLSRTFASKTDRGPRHRDRQSFSRWARSAGHIFPTARQRPPARARLLLYFLRGSVKYPTPNARSRIQVRRSTYVRLGFPALRVPLQAFPASLSRSHVISPFRRHFRSYYINLTLKRHSRTSRRSDFLVYRTPYDRYRLVRYV